MEEKIIKYFSELSFSQFKEIKAVKELEINDQDLMIVFQIIRDNLFILLDNHYLPVLFNYIKNKTSNSTCLKIKSLFINDYLVMSLNC